MHRLAYQNQPTFPNSSGIPTQLDGPALGWGIASHTKANSPSSKADQHFLTQLPNLPK